MTGISKTARFRRALLQKGPLFVLGWAMRWIYWNIKVYRVVQFLRGEAATLPLPVGLVAPDKHQPAPICDSMKQWCAQAAGADYRVVKGPIVVERRPPATIESSVHDSFMNLLRVEVPERALLQVPMGRVVGRNGLVVLPDGRFVGELVALTPAGRRSMLGNEPEFWKPLPITARRLPGCYYPLTTIGWQNYYHWNHDVIMRLHQVITALPPETRFLAPADLRAFHYESLQLLGIDRDRLTYFDGNEPIEVETLLFTVPIHKTQITSSESANWFRDVSHEAYGVAGRNPYRRIYLQRTFELDTHYRYANEAEVRECLQEYGFESIHPARLSFREQVELFAEAKVIAGTGTGLTNMVFAPTGALVLQFQEPRKVIHALWTLSEALRHHYWYFFGDTIPNSDPREQLPDIHVAIEKLRQSLDAMFARHGLSRAA